MVESRPTILVLREGEERLSMNDYYEHIKQQLPEYEVRLATTPAEECNLATDAEIITGGSLRNEVVENATQLQLFAATTAGCTHLPLDLLKEKNVSVTNAAGVAAPGIAEQAIGNMLVFSRELHKGWQQKQTKQWNHYQGSELQNCTVTIVGLGAIGKAVCQRLEGFGVNTIGIRYTPEKGGPTDEVYGYNTNSVHNALARSEYVIVACPLSETTSGLLGSEEFATLPPEAVVINCSRGGIIQTEQLVEALQKGKIRGAALDVTDPEPLPPDHPLWVLDNVLITPHMGGHTPYHWERITEILDKNVRIATTEGSYSGLKNQVL